MTEKRFTIIDGVKKGTHSGIWDNQKQNNQRIGDELWLGEVVAMLNEGVMIAKENEQLKQSNERIVKDIDLALGFIRHKGYSLQDIKDYEDAKKEYEEDLANYRKGDVE